jgi:hypothetical protein
VALKADRAGLVDPVAKVAAAADMAAVLPCSTFSSWGDKRLCEFNACAGETIFVRPRSIL